MSTPETKTTRRKLVPIQKTLSAKQKQLRARLTERICDIFVEREPDDQGAAAARSFAKDLTVATLERERQTLREIESALARMKVGRYGICDSCGKQIPEARLIALPWAMSCVACASRATTESVLGGETQTSSAAS